MVNSNISSEEKEVKRYSLFDRVVWNLFVKPGEVVEMRILGAFGKHPAWGGDYAKGTVSGYFDNHDAFCRKLRIVDRAGSTGVYFTVQVIDPRLIGRALNRLKPADKTTSDNNVLSYRWLPIDLDSSRPSGVSASASELKAAMELREVVAAWVIDNMGLSLPVKAMSGNGAHLLFRLPDLPVNEESQSFIKKTLQGISDRFSNDKVSIDTAVFNPARIWKAYGTRAKKGDEVPGNEYRAARPHRVSFIESLGEVSL